MKFSNEKRHPSSHNWMQTSSFAMKGKSNYYSGLSSVKLQKYEEQVGKSKLNVEKIVGAGLTKSLDIKHNIVLKTRPKLITFTTFELTSVGWIDVGNPTNPYFCLVYPGNKLP